MWPDETGHVHGATGRRRVHRGCWREAGAGVWPAIRSRNSGIRTGESLMTDVVMPQMGESIVEGTLTKWLKKKGEHIERDEPLFEISTDKVDTEIPSPVAGVLGDVLVAEGTTVAIGTVVGRIEDSNGAGSAAQPAAKPAAPEAPAPARSAEPVAPAAPAAPAAPT